MWAKADAPTYGWRAKGAMLVISEIAWAMRVDSWSPSPLSAISAALDLEVGGHGHEVRVAGALAVAVDAALHVGGARRDGGHRVRDRAAGVVVRVHAERGVGAGGDVGDDARDVVGQHAAVRVAQDQRRRSARPAPPSSALTA